MKEPSYRFILVEQGLPNFHAQNIHQFFSVFFNGQKVEQILIDRIESLLNSIPIHSRDDFLTILVDLAQLQRTSFPPK